MERHIKILTQLLKWNWNKSPELLDWRRWDKLTEYRYKWVMNDLIYSYLNNENSIAPHSY